MVFCCIGIGLMGIDLLLTRNVFVHIGELMAASIFSLILALVLDRTSEKDRQEQDAQRVSARGPRA